MKKKLKKIRKKIKDKWHGMALLLEKIFEYDWFGNKPNRELKKKIKNTIDKLTQNSS